MSDHTTTSAQPTAELEALHLCLAELEAREVERTVTLEQRTAELAIVNSVSRGEVCNGILAPAGCPQCGAQLPANRAEVSCACGQAVSLI